MDSSFLLNTSRFSPLPHSGQERYGNNEAFMNIGRIFSQRQLLAKSLLFLYEVYYVRRARDPSVAGR